MDLVAAGAGASGDWLLGGLEVRSSATDQHEMFACGRCLPGNGSLTQLVPGAVLLACKPAAPNKIMSCTRSVLTDEI